MLFRSFSIKNFNSNLLGDKRLFGCIDSDGDYVFLKDESYLKLVSKDKDSENSRMLCKRSTVFHVSQTDPIQ